MADENLDEHFVELVSSVSHANGVFRITLAQQVEAGTSRPITRLLIPANQLQAVLRGVADGYIFDVITNGLGLMYGLKDRLTPEERWAVVLYVRALQRSQNASAEDVPAGERAELGI